MQPPPGLAGGGAEPSRERMRLVNAAGPSGAANYGMLCAPSGWDVLPAVKRAQGIIPSVLRDPAPARLQA